MTEQEFVLLAIIIIGLLAVVYLAYSDWQIYKKNKQSKLAIIKIKKGRRK